MQGWKPCQKNEVPQVDRAFRGDGKGVAKVTWTEPSRVLGTSHHHAVRGLAAESGREIPESVQYLLHFAHGSEKQATALLDFIRCPTEE